MTCECLVLSVQPRFAEAIVDGLKTIEVRRRRPNVQPGTLGFVYSSSPIQAVVGSFRVDKIFSGTPEELWLVAQREAYLSRQDFEGYFAGVDIGHGIVVSCGQRLAKPIELSHLRDIWPGFTPPRSFGYLVAADASSRRMIAAIRDRLFNDRSALEEIDKNHLGKKSLQEHRGSFLLRWHEVKALSLLLGAGHGNGVFGRIRTPHPERLNPAEKHL